MSDEGGVHAAFWSLLYGSANANPNRPRPFTKAVSGTNANAWIKNSRLNFFQNFLRRIFRKFLPLTLNPIKEIENGHLECGRNDLHRM